MKARVIRPVLTLALAAAVFALGCDPKLLGTEGGAGTGTGTGDDAIPAAVTSEALIVGNIVAFHTDLIALSLALSSAFDSASVTLRSFDTACATVNELPIGSFGKYELLFDGCVDSHGTVYQGGGQLAVVNDQDGYTFLPLFEADLLRALNETNDAYNHTVLSPASTAGSFEFAFVRDEVGAVASVQVGKFLRHGVRGDVVTVSYADVVYTGAIGAYQPYPDVGSHSRVVWDGVGLFDVTYQAGGVATYTMQGANYSVNLVNGEVSVEEAPAT